MQGDLASERGIYRIETLPAAGDGQTFHGRFHTVARKESGRWRIAFDHDSNDAGPDDFAAADPPDQRGCGRLHSTAASSRRPPCRA